MARKSLEPNLWSVSDVFKHMYSVPVYQRPYSWESMQVNTLIDDIFSAFDLPDNNKEEGYFVGSIYIHDKGDKLKGLYQKYEIIDGQQRLTTISIILLTIFAIANKRGVDESDQTLIEIKKSLWKYVDRSYSKDNRAVTLNSIEKKCFSDIYDYCFSSPDDLKSYIEKYEPKNTFEKRVIDNFKIVYARIEEKFPTDEIDSLLSFVEFFLNYVQLISIDSTCSASKAFSIFESINSKGKPLDEIDKIKTFIFSKLDEKSYDRYLDLWGQLIIKTNDQLYDYLYNFVKAYISFYRQNIFIDNFKSLSKKEFLEYYKKTDIGEALKALLDDLYSKVDYYSLLSDDSVANVLVNNSEFRFFYRIFISMNYKHPKPLFMRCFDEYKSGKLAKKDFVDIVRETVKFMFEFLTISDRDSKDVITMFSAIMNDIYIRGLVDKNTIVNVLANEFITKGVTKERIKLDLLNMDAYEQNKKISVALLSLYEATSKQVNGTCRTSYDMAYTLLNDYGTTFSLDHLLVQTPDKNDSTFKYYKDDDDKLVLKTGHDFDSSVVQGMEYELFTRIVLNRIGNLRIFYKDNNSARQANAVQLKDYSTFTSFKKIKSRGTDVVDVLIDNCLPMPQYDATIKSMSSISESALPKMDKLIEVGIVKPGDQLYITTNPDNSIATLIDDTYVDYNGEKMRINDWGCKITGWKSIRIYVYAGIVGQTETLQQKRIEYITSHNDD